MALPKLEAPSFDLELPSNQQKIRYRPFLVKEEKVLLVAIESGDEKDIVQAVRDIVKACIVEPEEMDAFLLPSFDLEYVFLHIRSKSVGEDIDVGFRHPNNYNSKEHACDHIQEVKINIADLKIVAGENHSKKIQLTDTIGVVMKYPCLDLYKHAIEEKDDIDLTFKLIQGCLDKVWDGDNVIDASTQTDEELEAFLDNFTKDQFQKIKAFFNTMPKLRHEFTYKCDECKCEETVIMEGLADFFG